MANNEIKVQGKYAEQRKEILENHAPDMYKAMLENGSLEEHLMSVQSSAERYVDNYVARFTHSDEYLKAEKKDPAEAMRLLNMTTLEAEDAAYRIWVANLESDEENDEDEGE
ncbi:MAG: TnpV protein [Lachnospiraceae bacterium]|nr:TnpV protein [Lachnospiraceae bacterium]